MSALTRLLPVVVVLLLLVVAGSAVADPPGSQSPPVGAGFSEGAGDGNNGVAVGGEQSSPGSPGGAQPVDAGPASRTITCDLSGAISTPCQGAAATCLRPPLAPPTNTTVTEQQQPDGSWRQTRIDCDGNGADDTLAVTAAMVRQQVVKLLPPVPVGIAPAHGPTLVNLETIFWSPTPPIRPLGPVTILGQQVTITIRFHHATYDYGDGTHATTTTPGTPWTAAACTTTQCPTLDGHTYTRPASKLTATTTITWTATFTVGGGPAQPIPGTITGPTSRHDLQVLQGRSVIAR